MVGEGERCQRALLRLSPLTDAWQPLGREIPLDLVGLAPLLCSLPLCRALCFHYEELGLPPLAPGLIPSLRGLLLGGLGPERQSALRAWLALLSHLQLLPLVRETEVALPVREGPAGAALRELYGLFAAQWEHTPELCVPKDLPSAWLVRAEEHSRACRRVAGAVLVRELGEGLRRALGAAPVDVAVQRGT